MAESSLARSVADLSAIAEAGHNGADRHLGRQALAALTSMVESPHRAAVQTISQIAREAGVDPSTLTRLGKRLGFSGFTELQEIFRKHVAEQGSYYSARTKNLIDRQRSDGRGGIQELANDEIGRVLETATELNGEDVKRAADIVCRAGTVYVLGLRATHSIAYFLGTFIGFLRPRVLILGGGGAGIAEELAQITEEDALIAITFRPYTQLTVDACNAMTKRNVPIVSLTDLASPIAGDGPRRVTLRAWGPFYFNSALSNLFIAQILLSGIAQRLGGKTTSHMENLEELLREMSIETE